MIIPILMYYSLGEINARINVNKIFQLNGLVPSIIKFNFLK
jgi:hypothetical protein